MKSYLYYTGCIAASVMASGSALAQEAAEPVQQYSTGIQDIVVTATKRSENLQKVPIAISAVSAEALEGGRIEGVKELDMTTPGLTMTNGGFVQTPFLRGVGSSDPTAGQEAPIATYVDGVYQPMPWANTIPFNNVERIEVLKGPQGTLFGRNATGGLIHIVTKDPTDELSGNFSASYGNYDTYTAKGYLASGLAEGVSADVAAYYSNQRDGFGKNLFNGDDIFTSEDFAVRSKLLIKPGDRTRITIAGDYRYQNSTNAYNYRLVPGTVAIDGSTATPGFYDVNLDLSPKIKMEIWSVSARIEHEFDPFTITSVSAYQDAVIRLNLDNDGTASNTVGAQTDAAISKAFSQELQISSNPGAPFRWIAGLYYLDMKAGFGGPKGIQLFGSDVIGGGLAVDIINVIYTKSYAAFAELGFDIGDSTRLTVGGRYSRDERKLRARTVLDAAPLGNDPIMTLSEDNLKTHFEEPTYRIILDHDFTRSVMGYASYSRGFKSGNYNTSNAANPAFKPEILDAYEVGMKGRFLDGTLQLNAAAFYYDYSNLQLVEHTGNTSNVINAAKSEIKGFEIDGIIAPTNNLQFHVGYTYLDGKYKDFKTAGCFYPAPGGGNTLTTCDVSGNPIVRTPRHAVNLGGDYTVPTSVGDFRLAMSYYFNSGVIFSPEERLKQGAYDVLNGSINWTSENSRFRVSLYGKNILDRKYVGYMIAQTIGDTQVASPPRTYGLELGYKF